MAHAAEVGPDGTVIKVIVIPDVLPDGVSFDEFCAPHGAKGSTWRRTYKGSRGTANPRKNYAGPGYRFDAGRNAFVPPKPSDPETKRVFDSWVIDDETALWKAPKEMPSDGNDYRWDEATATWVLAADRR